MGQQQQQRGFDSKWYEMETEGSSEDESWYKLRTMWFRGQHFQWKKIKVSRTANEDKTCFNWLKSSWWKKKKKKKKKKKTNERINLEMINAKKYRTFDPTGGKRSRPTGLEGRHDKAEQDGSKATAQSPSLGLCTTICSCEREQRSDVSTIGTYMELPLVATTKLPREDSVTYSAGCEARLIWLSYWTGAWAWGKNKAKPKENVRSLPLNKIANPSLSREVSSGLPELQTLCPAKQPFKKTSRSRKEAPVPVVIILR